MNSTDRFLIFYNALSYLKFFLFSFRLLCRYSFVCYVYINMYFRFVCIVFRTAELLLSHLIHPSRKEPLLWKESKI